MADYDVLGLEEATRWKQELATLDTKPDIHFTPGYCGLYRNWGEPRLFIYCDAGTTILYPFILRRVEPPWDGADYFDEPYYDITSPYGYGGPLAGHSAGTTDWDRFYWYFASYCRENNIITEFIRFHPVLCNHRWLVEHLTVQKVSSVICLDTTLSDEDIWSGYKRNNRNNIRKASREGIEVVIEPSTAHFQDFIQIYHHTLDRNDADGFYYFDQDFYTSLHHNLKGNYVYAHALKDGCVVSTELLLYNGTYIHSFLGGTLEEFYQFRPNNLLKHEMICWAKERGIKYFMLGGGRREHDGIFRYKRSFASYGLLNFYIGKKIHDPIAVAKLECCFAKHKPVQRDDFFPGYRRYK
ncbi:MAG: lipid II:glycine glycyltransferase FemX [Pelotomaculum sp.]